MTFNPDQLAQAAADALPGAAQRQAKRKIRNDLTVAKWRLGWSLLILVAFAALYFFNNAHGKDNTLLWCIGLSWLLTTSIAIVRYRSVKRKSGKGEKGIEEKGPEEIKLA